MTSASLNLHKGGIYCVKLHKGSHSYFACGDPLLLQLCLSKTLRQLAQTLALHLSAVNQLPKQTGSRTRKDGFQAALSFGSSLCAEGPREWRPGWAGVGLAAADTSASRGMAACRQGSVRPSMRARARPGSPGASVLSHKRPSGS